MTTTGDSPNGTLLGRLLGRLLALFRGAPSTPSTPSVPTPTLVPPPSPRQARRRVRVTPTAGPAPSPRAGGVRTVDLTTGPTDEGRTTKVVELGAWTAHSVELSQLADINRRLRYPRQVSPITAQDIGAPAADVPPTAVLIALHWDGPPEYPYVHARFSTDPQSRPVSVDLHTAALREISRRLGLQQVWGC